MHYNGTANVAVTSVKRRTKYWQHTLEMPMRRGDRLSSQDVYKYVLPSYAVELLLHISPGRRS
jgi:hypothetical protein